MRNFVAVTLTFIVLVIAPASANAQDASWRISALEGVVRVTEPGRPATEARVNQPLMVGATITTGADSRASVENGRERIVMAANSRMTIGSDSRSGMTRILQDLGALLFQVDRQDQLHFRVETPLLAAVVKGTAFTVTTSPQQDMVHVTHGLVEVRANQGGAVRGVSAGETVRIARAAPNTFASATGTAESGAPITAPPLDYAAASGGVVSGPGQTSAGAAAAPAQTNAHQTPGAGVGEASTSSGIIGQSVAAVRHAIAWVTRTFDSPGPGVGGSNAGGNSGAGNAGGNSGASNAGGNSGAGNAGGNSGAGNAGGNAGGNSSAGNAGGNSSAGNAGGNSGAGNAGGNSSAGNAGGNSGAGNAGGNSSASNAGGNSSVSNAGGNSAYASAVGRNRAAP